jgi:hypothetical protein
MALTRRGFVAGLGSVPVATFASGLHAAPPRGLPASVLEGQFDWQSALRPGEFRDSAAVLHLVPHDGRLFAGVHVGRGARSYFFRLDEPGGRWVVDHDFGPFTSRTGALAAVTFGTDGTGSAIQPVTLLLGATDQVRGRRQGPIDVPVHVRDDATGRWMPTVLGQMHGQQAIFRCVAVHRDAVTGADMVFTGLSPAPLGIFSGTCDPAQPGRIRWSAAPEFEADTLDDRAQRRKVFGFARANGVLYASTTETILRRVDGPNPAWEEVFAGRAERTLTYPGFGVEPIRGITAVPAPDGKGEQLLIVWNNAVRRLDPARGFAQVVEIELLPFLGREIGTQAEYVQGAFNDVPRIEVPGKDDPFWWIGLNVRYDPAALAASPAPPPHDKGFARTGWFLERRVRAGTTTFELRAVFDPRAPDDWLDSPRVLVPSPFARDEGRVFYAGGFNPHDARPAPTAWVYRGTIR